MNKSYESIMSQIKLIKAKPNQRNPYACFIWAAMKSRVHYDVCHDLLITADHGMPSCGTWHYPFFIRDPNSKKNWFCSPSKLHKSFAPIYCIYHDVTVVVNVGRNWWSETRKYLSYWILIKEKDTWVWQADGCNMLWQVPIYFIPCYWVHVSCSLA